MKIVGNTYPIHDAKGKVTGETVYAGDMQLKGMLHVAVLFSTIPHGFVKAIDESKALALTGVVKVLHCFNTTENLFSRYRTVKGQEVPEQERVFNDHVRFVGDRVAAVVAETEEIAREAVKLIEVTYEELPYAVNMKEALSGKIDDVHKEGAVYGDFHVEVGNKEAIAADAVETTTTSYLSRISHATMETHCCVASYDRGLDELTIWSPNQSVHGIRTVIGDLFEMPYHKVRVIKATMGGSFGGKQEWMLEPVAACCTLEVGKPVKLVFNREEALVSTISRSPMDGTITSKVTKDGYLQSFQADISVDAGAYLGNSYDYVCAMANKFYRCYKYPFVDYTGRAVITNTPVSGAFRGWTSPELTTMTEHNLNMAARQIGMDPVDLRLKNVALPGDIDIRYNETLGEIRLKEAIELGREKFEWDKRKEEVKTFNEENTRYKRGIGIGCGGHLNGYYSRKPDFATVDMRMTESGSVQVNVTIHDHGCGSVTAFKMIAAEELGLPVDMVLVREGDTGVSPFDYGCYSSRTTYVIGKAAQECAKLIKKKLQENIASIHNIPAGEVIVEDGKVYSKRDASIHYTYGEAAVASLKYIQKEVIATYQHINTTNPGVTGAHFAMVEVDTYTGMTKILDYVAVHDIGQAINREICIAQIQGSVIMGSGAALSEHMTTHENGVSTSSLKDYHMINSFEAPNVRVELIEDGGTEGPYGSKSIGEVAHVPVAATIVGAVNDALGTDIGSIPINPDVIAKHMMQTGGIK